MFSDGGKQINQRLNSRAGLAVNNAVFSRLSFLRPYCIIMILITFASVRFTGVLFVQDDVTNDDDVVGFLFGYQVPLENYPVWT